MEKLFKLICFEIVFRWTVNCCCCYVSERASNFYRCSLNFCFGVFQLFEVCYCGFNKNCWAPMGCSVGVISATEVISRDDKVGFRGEMRLADEEDVNMVES